MSAAPPAAARAGRRRIEPWTLAGAALLVLLLFFSVLPMAWMLATSIKTQFAAVQYPPEWIPRNPTLEQYRQLLSPANEVGREFLGYNLLFYTVLVRNMFPAVVFLMPLFIMMRWMGLVNTHASLILTYLTFGLPLSIWLLKGFYDNIPVKLEQAARIDGASRFKAFLLVVMPLSAPGIIATAIYSFITAWNEYVYALTFLNDKSRLTLPVGLQRFFTEFASNWPGLMAASLIMSVHVVVLFLVLQKWFVKALTEGAVKS